MSKNISMKAQAIRIAKSEIKTKVTNGSLGKSFKYIEAIALFGNWCKDAYSINKIDRITPEIAEIYLYERAEVVSQSKLDQDRQAINLLTTRKKSKLYNHKFIRIKSSVITVLSSRYYTDEQITMIKEKQQQGNGFATEIAHAAGLRAHELFTIRKLHEQPVSNRMWNKNLFVGKEKWVRYSVKGKGGLIREVRLPENLALQLESYRLPKPITIVDREIRYESLYLLKGGKNWSSSFSKASKNTHGWSNGAHGCRHSYAQNRLNELQALGMQFDDAKLICSQELGHHRASIVDIYLR